MFFIIGGNGFVGSAFARYCKINKLAYQIITRENYADYVGQSCDVLINANGNSKKFLGADDPKREFLESVVSVRNSLVDFKFKRYIFLSTSDIYPDCSSSALTDEAIRPNIAAQSPYGFHKYIAEQCVQHSADEWLILRQGGFVGAGLKKNAVFDALYGEKLWVHADSRFQFINTDESAACIMQLIQQGVSKEVFNVTAQGTISARDIMAMAGRSIPYNEAASPVVYEISTAKIAQYIDLPDSYETVAEFIKSIKA